MYDSNDMWFGLIKNIGSESSGRSIPESRSQNSVILKVGVTHMLQNMYSISDITPSLFSNTSKIICNVSSVCVDLVNHR